MHHSNLINGTLLANANLFFYAEKLINMFCLQKSLVYSCNICSINRLLEILKRV